MPRVLNKYTDSTTSNTVYIGRPSKWGNPFVVGKDGNRSQVIQKYTEWLAEQEDLLEDIDEELRGKDLLCYCAPKPCHGDILLEIANR